MLMEVGEAREIVSGLANGVDPVTGEMLDDDSPYNDPKVIRALFTVLNASKGFRTGRKTLEEKQQDNVAAGRPRNAGLPWTDELRAEIAELHEDGKSFADLARHFERTEGAILSELARQGLIDHPVAGQVR